MLQKKQKEVFFKFNPLNIKDQTKINDPQFYKERKLA